MIGSKRTAFGQCGSPLIHAFRIAASKIANNMDNHLVLAALQAEQSSFSQSLHLRCSRLTSRLSSSTPSTRATRLKYLDVPMSGSSDSVIG
jgi:hypothetical protein